MTRSHCASLIGINYFKFQKDTMKRKRKSFLKKFHMKTINAIHSCKINDDYLIYIYLCKRAFCSQFTFAFVKMPHDIKIIQNTSNT